MTYLIVLINIGNHKENIWDFKVYYTIISVEIRHIYTNIYTYICKCMSVHMYLH